MIVSIGLEKIIVFKYKSTHITVRSCICYSTRSILNNTINKVENRLETKGDTNHKAYTTQYVALRVCFKVAQL